MTELSNYRPSPRVQILEDTCAGFGFRGTSVIRAADSLMQRILQRTSSRFPSNPAMYEHQLLQTADILARCKMPPYVVAAALCHSSPEQALSQAHFSRTAQVSRTYNFLMDLPSPTMADPSTIDNHQNMLLSWHNYPLDINTSPRVLFHAHMLMAAQQLSRLRMATSDDIGILSNPLLQAQTATSTALFLKKIGMDDLAQEMLDLTFGILDPASYRHTISVLHLSSTYSEKREFLDFIVKLLNNSVPSNLRKTGFELPGVGFSITGRLKSLSSAAEKIGRIGGVPDAIGCRIVLSHPFAMGSITQIEEARQASADEEELARLETAYLDAVDLIFRCERVLDLIAQTRDWEKITDRRRDWISAPKDNGYQALQVTYRTQDGRFDFEVQLRTIEMHMEAEYGQASHLLYKAGEKPSYAGFESADPYTRFRKLYEQAQSNPRCFGFLYDNLSANGSADIRGPFEIVLPNYEKSPSVFDLLVAAGVELPFSCKNASIFDPDTGQEKTVMPFSPVSDGVILRPNMGRSAGLSTKAQSSLASEPAILAFSSAKLRSELGVEDIEAARSSGRQLLDQTLAAVRSEQQKTAPSHLLYGRRIEVQTIIPDAILAKSMGFASIDDMTLVLGSQKADQARLESTLRNLLITAFIDRRSRRTIFLTQRSSGMTQYILSAIADLGINITTAEISTRGDVTTFSAGFEDESADVFETITSILENPKEISAVKNTPLNAYSRELTIDVIIRQDRPGIINDVIRECINKNCIISTVSAPEPQDGRLRIVLGVRFMKSTSEKSVQAFLTSLKQNVEGLSKVSLVP